MAAGTQHPIPSNSDPGALERAALDRVLASPGFRRAPTLANLLRYLCEKRFAGEAAQIKEYSIGVEVFARGANFDQDSNSIVRVEANRLRKRLAEYYAGEGAEEPLKITIPIGQYVPEFLVHHPLPGQPAVAELPASSPDATRRLLWQGFSGAAVLLVLAVVGAWLLGRHQVQPAPLAQPLPSASNGATIGLPAGQEIRLLAGSTRSFLDHAGKLWSADTFYTGGDAVKSDLHHIGRTQDPDFYRTSRQGSFRYDIPLEKGVYELRLHFAETVYGPEESEPGGEGSRILSISANGAALLRALDVVADAGGSAVADVKVFTGIRPASDGKLHLEFSAQNGRPAMLSAIEILPGAHGQIRPIRILARQTPYYSNNSQWWSPDSYFEGGQMAAYTTPVSATDDPELYETERWGNFSYAIPVTPGRYAVTLHFAARAGTGPAHRFNVFCNGKALLQNFDLGKETPNAVVRHFNGLEPNAQGKLLLAFVPVEGYATVTGIEVLPQ